MPGIIDQFDDPNLPGAMQVTISLGRVSCGTDLTIVQEGVPSAIPVEFCYLGWQESLSLLAHLVEPEIPDGTSLLARWSLVQVRSMAKRCGHATGGLSCKKRDAADSTSELLLNPGVWRRSPFKTNKSDMTMVHHDIPFQVIDWLGIEQTEHKGQRGSAFWKTLQYPGLRIRIVTYSAGYIADHWCQKGHIVHCLDGELMTEHENGEKYVLKEGMTYVVSDDLSSHRSVAAKEVRLLIIDGDFLMPERHRQTDAAPQ